VVGQVLMMKLRVLYQGKQMQMAEGLRSYAQIAADISGMSFLVKNLHLRIPAIVLIQFP
jgi:hypothetical protein